MRGEHPDWTALFGSTVVDDSRRCLGRVTALVHRAGGCDVLVERRHWLRHRVLRLDLDDLVPSGRTEFLHRPSPARLRQGPGDGRVA